MRASAVALSLVRDHGILGLFRGCIPPLIGSSIYRGVMMSGYEMSYTFIELNAPSDSWLKQEFLGFVKPAVPVSVVFCSLARGLVEGFFFFKVNV